MPILPPAGPAGRTADVPAPPATGDPMTTNVWDLGHRSEKSATNPIHGVWLGAPVRTGRGLEVWSAPRPTGKERASAGGRRRPRIGRGTRSGFTVVAACPGGGALGRRSARVGLGGCPGREPAGEWVDRARPTMADEEALHPEVS